jgi:Domain of unknown function (DUF4157)
MNPLQARLSQIRRFARQVYSPHRLALRQGVPEVLRALAVPPARTAGPRATMQPRGNTQKRANPIPRVSSVQEAQGKQAVTQRTVSRSQPLDTQETRFATQNLESPMRDETRLEREVERLPEVQSARVITDSPVPESLRAALDAMIARNNPGFAAPIYNSNVEPSSGAAPTNDDANEVMLEGDDASEVAPLDAAEPETLEMNEVVSDEDLTAEPVSADAAQIAEETIAPLANASLELRDSAPNVEPNTATLELVQSASLNAAEAESLETSTASSETISSQPVGSVGGTQAPTEPTVIIAPTLEARAEQSTLSSPNLVSSPGDAVQPTSRGRVVEEYRARPPRNLPVRTPKAELSPSVPSQAQAEPRPENAPVQNEAADPEKQPEVWAERLRRAFSPDQDTAAPTNPTQPSAPQTPQGSSSEGEPVRAIISEAPQRLEGITSQQSQQQQLERLVDEVMGDAPELASAPDTDSVAVLKKLPASQLSEINAQNPEASESEEAASKSLETSSAPSSNKAARDAITPAATIVQPIPTDPALRTPGDWGRALMATYAPNPTPTTETVAPRDAVSPEAIPVTNAQKNAVPAPLQSRNTNRRNEATGLLQPRRFVAPLSPKGRETRGAENAIAETVRSEPSSLPAHNAPKRIPSVQPTSAQPESIRTPREETTSLEALNTPDAVLETISETQIPEARAEAPQADVIQDNAAQISPASTDPLQQAIAQLNRLEQSPPPVNPVLNPVGEQHSANRTHERDANRTHERDAPAAPAEAPAPLERVQLSGHARRFLEPLVGFDPEQVNVFTGEAVRLAARDLGADAAAVNGDVLLPNVANLESPEGLGLLAHELTHVPEQVNRVQTNETAQLETRAQSEPLRSPRRFVAPLPTLAPITQDVPFATEEDRARRAEARATQIARNAEPVRDVSRWNGLPAPWEPMPSFERSDAEEGVISLVGAGLSTSAWGNEVSAPSWSTEGAASSSTEGTASSSFTAPAAYSSSAPSSAASSSATSSGGAQLAETGREMPAETGGSGGGAAGGGGEDMEKLARQVYDVLKRKLLSERRREGY